MDLVITSAGAQLSRSGEVFIIQTPNAKQEVPARKVRSLLISTTVLLSSDVITLALERDIDVLFLDAHGDPIGRIWHGRPGSTPAIRRAQLRLADTEEGLQLALSWLLCKVDHQIQFLQQSLRKRSPTAELLSTGINELILQRQSLATVKGRLESRRNTILLLEARIGKLYWRLINLFLPENYQFTARSRHPALDEFNCLLNYAYGVLYGSVERACIVAGLDPYCGFIHTDHYNKMSLVFDLIECYRIWADETVLSLFASGQVESALFEPTQPTGLLLGKQGKQVLMGQFNEFLDQAIRHRRRNLKRRDIIQFDCHQLAGSLIGRNENEKD